MFHTWLKYSNGGGYTLINIKNVNFSYDKVESSKNCLKNINLTIEKGEFVVLCGKSGCGKTSVTRLINGLIPHFHEGVLTGEVKVNGENICNLSLAQISRLVGSVFQNPRSQFFNVDTTSELAFGCENLAMPVNDIMERVSKSTEIFKLHNLIDRSIFELSGGEKQRIACASVYATLPEVFLLDEPSSNLDSESIENLKDVLQILKGMGKTIIISEHRLYYLRDLANRFIYMENGSICREYSNVEMRESHPEDLVKKGLRTLNLNQISTEVSEMKRGNSCFDFENIVCRRGKKDVLNISKLQIPKGEIVGVIGKNGAGKSTFVSCFSGILKHKGKIFLDGKEIKGKSRLLRSYMVMQDVNHQLFCESVNEELALNITDERKENISNILEKMNLQKYKEVHPLSLSGGEKQRVAIGSAICSGKEFLFYDEPTSGLDFTGMNVTCSMIKQANENALLSMVITHDLEFLLRCCTSVLHIEDGTVKEYYSLREADSIAKVKKNFILKEGI